MHVNKISKLHPIIQRVHLPSAIAPPATTETQRVRYQCRFFVFHVPHIYSPSISSRLPSTRSACSKVEGRGVLSSSVVSLMSSSSVAVVMLTALLVRVRVRVRVLREVHGLVFFLGLAPSRYDIGHGQYLSHEDDDHHSHDHDI